MTRKEREIITKKVRDEYLSLQQYEGLYGLDNPCTNRARSRWASLDELYYSLFGDRNY